MGEDWGAGGMKIRSEDRRRVDWGFVILGGRWLGWESREQRFGGR